MEKKDIIHILPDSNLVCFVVPALLSKQQCDSLLNQLGKSSPQNPHTHYPTYYRNNNRMAIDNPKMASWIFELAKPYIPEKIQTQPEFYIETWKLKELNERLRFCCYTANQYFHKHLDGVFFRSRTIQSKLTFMLYLNDSKEFEGGRTLFYRSQHDDEIWAAYTPQIGDLIIFDHNIWHEGEEVVSGEKYILRSDIIYELSNLKLPGEEEEQDKIPLENANPKTIRLSNLKFPKEIKEEQPRVILKLPDPAFDKITIDKTPTPGIIPYEEGHLGYVWKILFFDENTLLSGGRDKTIKVWDESGQCTQSIEAHESSVLCLEKMNNQTFISGSRDQTIKVWEKRINARLKFDLVKTIDVNESLILHLCRLDNQTFACGSGDNDIKIFNLQGQEIGCLKGHSDWVWQIVKIDNDTIASCSEDGTIKIWDWKNNRLLDTISVGISVHSLVSVNNESVLIAGLLNGNIVIYKDVGHFNPQNISCAQSAVSEWVHATTIPAHKAIVRTLLLVGNKILVSGSEDNSIQVWDWRIPYFQTEFQHQNFVQSLALNKNKQLLSGSYDGKIKIWDLPSGIAKYIP